eukprot:13155527-Alexandrium_andersonii.AAC.1
MPVLGSAQAPTATTVNPPTGDPGSIAVAGAPLIAADVVPLIAARTLAGELATVAATGVAT